MGHIPVNRAGLTCAGVLAGWHAIWAVLAATGAAQRVYDFAFRLHFMQSEAAVGAFDVGTAGMLILTTAMVGYASGAALAIIWNGLTALSETGGKPARAR